MFKQDDEETPVLFRKWGARRGGDVDAYFPTHPGTYEPHTCSCYAHVGQHGSADLAYVIGKTRPAKPEEYAALKKELESAPFGYRLKVYARNQRRFTIERLRELRRTA